MPKVEARESLSAVCVRYTWWGFSVPASRCAVVTSASHAGGRNFRIAETDKNGVSEQRSMEHARRILFRF